MNKIFLIFSFLFLFMSSQAYSQEFIVCRGDTKTYSVDTADGPTGTSGSNYTWTLTGPANNASITGNGTNSISIAWNTTPAGRYLLTVTETNSGYSSPCGTDPVTVDIVIKENPVITASSIDVCAGVTKSLTATLSSGDAGGVYTWAVPGGVTDPGNVASFSTGTAGNYSVRYKENNGCVSNTVNPVVVVYPLPNAAISPVTGASTTFCEGSSVELSTTDNLISYTWNRNGSFVGSGNRRFIVYDSGDYTVTVKDANNCSNTTTIATKVTVNPLPNAVTISADSFTEFCQGSSVNLTSSDTTVSNTYQWTNDSNTVVGTNSATFNATATGVYKVKVTNGNGCSTVSSTQPVQVRPNPDAQISWSTFLDFCDGGSAPLTILNPGVNDEYQWIKDGVNITTNATSRDYIATQSGKYKIKVIDKRYSTSCTSTTNEADAAIVINRPLPVTSTIVY